MTGVDNLMYDVGGKLLIVFTSMYVNSLVCVKVSFLRVNNGVKLWCVMSSWIFTEGIMKKVRMEIVRLLECRGFGITW